MNRNVDLAEISDGRLYAAQEKVRCGVGDCAGCHECCSVTGDTIILDPYDAALLCAVLDCNFDSLLERCVGLRPVDGLILPYLKKTKKLVCGIEEECCVFLDEGGRCMIHEVRPGFCRLFPLGRVYDAETRDFSYFLQIHECPKIDPDTIAAKGFPLPTKVRVADWLGIDSLPEYEQYIRDWHFLTKDLEAVLMAHPEEEFVKKLCMAVLNLFFRRAYGQDGAVSFYEEFQVRLTQMKEIIAD